MSFGLHLRPQWLLDPGVTFLNHGSFGATPRVVLAAQRQWQDRLEQQPVQFMSHTGPAEVRRVAGLLAAVLGTVGENLVLVDNATTGINAVLRSFPWCPGDRLLLTSHTYGAIRKAATFIHQTRGVDLVELALPFPGAEPQAILTALEEALQTPCRLALLDHITSTTALVLPLKAMIACCHRYGVPVLVDGAHAPGMVEVNLADLGADWYAGNAHKWLFTPKGCGFLYTAPSWQAQTQPLVISWGGGEGYTAGFDWPGTRDLSHWLAIPAALDFYREFGPAALRRHNQDLAWTAGPLLAQAWGVPVPTPEALIGAMMTLPLLEPWHGRPHLAQAIHDQLLNQYLIEVPMVPFGDRLWVRISAQVYNHLGEYERLAEVFAAPGGFNLTG